MQLEHVLCDLCGGKDYKVRYTKPDNWLRTTLYLFPVVECLNCGLVYVNPRPTLDSMADFYPPDYHSDRDSEEHLRRYAAQKALLPDLAGKHVLDIGCAKGDFLAYLLDSGPDFHAHGVDAFSPGVSDDRIRFTRGVFTDAGYSSSQFDLVMSWAVFEHIHSPSAYFSEVARVLRPGGKLIILVTNSESAYGRIAHTEDVPRHTYHYSPKTLDRYGRKTALHLRDIQFRDDIFDGRGFGTFAMLAGRLAGFTWEKEMLGKTKAHQRLAMFLGRGIDRLAFATHWEARLRRSGIMVATYEKV